MNFTPESLKAFLKTANPQLYNLYNSLDEEVSFSWIMKCMEELKETGKSPSLEFLTNIDYERQPVSARQFFTDPYYLGKATTWERWKHELEHIALADHVFWLAVTLDFLP